MWQAHGQRHSFWFRLRRPGDNAPYLSASSFRDKTTGSLVELPFYVVSQFKRVFKIIVNPVADFFDFRARQLWDHGFDFFNRAPGGRRKPRMNANAHEFMRRGTTIRSGTITRR